MSPFHPDWRPDQPQQLGCDADGQVLLHTHLPLWSWQLLAHHAETETEPR